MPLWNPKPPEGGRSVPFRLIRVPAKGSIRGVITSVEPLACSTHYVAHRTIPCEGPDDCKACQQGHTARWHCYVALILSGSMEQVILELTAAGSDPLRNYCLIHGGIRGCLLTATRPSGRANGRVVATCQPAKVDGVTIPPPPDLQRLLCHIWGIKHDAAAAAEATLDRGARHIPFPLEGEDARYTA